MDTLSLATLALGLGLFGFIEPCTVGSHLLFVKYLEDKSGRAKLAQTVVFAVTRAIFIGALGATAAFLGTAFFNLQKGFWLLLGPATSLSAFCICSESREGWCAASGRTLDA